MMLHILNAFSLLEV